MGRVMLCVGKYAGKPFYIEQTQQNVYCIEELCYCLQENAFLIDQSIVSKSLAEWIDRECGLPELAGQLYGYVNAGCSVSVFVTVILEYAGYCSEEDIKNTGVLLQNNAGLGDLEKRKAHADYMLQQRRYARAVREYDRILAQNTEAAGSRRAALLHNKGAALAGLFLFAAAAQCFQEAYEEDGDRESGLSYLAAMRFSMNEQEYIRFIADQKGAYGPSLELEERMEKSVRQWEDSPQADAWKRLIELKQDGRMAEYYEQSVRLAEQLKEDYKRMA